MSPLFYITHLYPDKMNIYGDYGNILTIKKRLEFYGFTPIYQKVMLGQKLPLQTDFYFIGGGQDSDQMEVFKDLLTKKERLIKDIEDNISLLAICGGYQLLGKQFVTAKKDIIDGIGLFEVITKAPDDKVKNRCIGNLFVISNIPELENYLLVGFENHSGQTYSIIEKKYKSDSSKNLLPEKKDQFLGKVIYGYGNNIEEKYEGFKYKNAIGTYLHGSCLPKNPKLADFFIQKAIRRKTEKGIINPSIYLESMKKEYNDEIAIAIRKNLILKYNLTNVLTNVII